MKKYKFKTISILGVGLIGGSIGLAIKKRKIARFVIGLATKRRTLSCALSRKAIDKSTLSLKEAVRDADMILVCAPVKMIPQIVKKITPHVKSGCIITDVGSTKYEIVKGIEKGLRDDIHFVGGHPMAGSEKRGVEFASSDLFENSICILTKTNKTDLRSLRQISNFWKSLGAKVKIMSPADHDEIIARVSHLPHLAAVAIVRQIKKSDFDFISTGFKSTTRISEAAEDIWRDICLTNKKEILKSLDRYIDILKEIKKKINRSNSQGIISEFRKARALREILKK